VIEYCHPGLAAAVWPQTGAVHAQHNNSAAAKRLDTPEKFSRSMSSSMSSAQEQSVFIFNVPPQKVHKPGHINRLPGFWCFLFSNVL
jgi:hypothetical protein